MNLIFEQVFQNVCNSHFFQLPWEAVSLFQCFSLGFFFFFFTDYIYTNKFVLFWSRKFCLKWVLLNLTTIFESKVTFEYFQNENIPNDDEILHC